jgi:hypothetical protein
MFSERLVAFGPDPRINLGLLDILDFDDETRYLRDEPRREMPHNE